MNTKNLVHNCVYIYIEWEREREKEKDEITKRNNRQSHKNKIHDQNSKNIAILKQ